MDRDERHDRSERAERLTQYLTELQERIDPRSLELLMRLLRELSTSPAVRGGTYELGMGPEEKELFTPALQAELLVLFGLLTSQDERVVVDLGDSPHAKGMKVLVPQDRAQDPDFLHRHKQRVAAEAEQREADRREVEGIARASGMEP
ncbi:MULTISPECIES: hypothetical protein [Streptomyces]|jgi:hypothetical protein|nr:MULTISPECIES: hypothetical protein [Streptomyces]QLH21926.1 hypothetical protein HYQ63_16000 [Streptomyces sp. Rer75]RNG22505.1 hypothetical protein EEJ42_20185 [Streptomyces botrytidirepellens]